MTSSNDRVPFTPEEAELHQLHTAIHALLHKAMRACSRREKTWLRLNVCVEKGQLSKIQLVEDEDFPLDGKAANQRRVPESA
jgi:hypothetical protein